MLCVMVLTASRQSCDGDQSSKSVMLAHVFDVLGPCHPRAHYACGRGTRLFVLELAL
jgi:hypothetical protein